MAEDRKKIHIDFRGRQMETRWTRYRAAKLADMGFSDWEIMALKYNRMTNPRVQAFFKEIRAEIERIRVAHGFSTHQAAAAYRRAHWVEMIDSGEISEYDPYIRMGYWD